jgi:DNA-binding MurR/RpiR family transcriptional regulator
MTEKNNANLLDARIREHYESMPPSEKRLADLLLSFPGHVADYSASELCELAQTSKAAATRFFSRLGYKDFNEARRQAREAKNWGALLYQSTPADQQQRPTQASKRVSLHIEREQTNIQRTLEGIEATTLRAVTKAIMHHKRVLVLGYRNNRFLAEYLHRQLSIIRDNVSLHPGANQSLSEELFNVGEDDLLIVLGMRRRTPILEKIVSLAATRKANIALISDPTAAALEKYATWKISCMVHSTSAFDSYTSVMSTLSLIITQLVDENPAVLERLSAIEDMHEQLDELSTF